MTEAAVNDLLGTPPPAASTSTPPPTGPTPAPPATPAEQPPATPAGEDQRVPFPRFKEVNDQKAALSIEVEELRKFKEEHEAAKLSEIEKEQRAREQAEARAIAAEEKAVTLERSAWVKAAASDAGFIDPSDAVLDLDLSKLENEDAATAAVKELAEKKPHWLAAGNQQQRPQGFGHLGGQQPTPPVPVGEDGKPDEKAGFGREIMQHLFPPRR